MMGFASRRFKGTCDVRTPAHSNGCSDRDTRKHKAYASVNGLKLHREWVLVVGRFNERDSYSELVAEVLAASVAVDGWREQNKQTHE